MFLNGLIPVHESNIFVHIFQMEVETLAAGISALAVSDISDLMRKITTLSNKLKTIQEQQVCGSVKHLLLAVDYRQVRGIICSLSMYVKIDFGDISKITTAPKTI